MALTGRSTRACGSASETVCPGRAVGSLLLLADGDPRQHQRRRESREREQKRRPGDGAREEHASSSAAGHPRLSSGRRVNRDEALMWRPGRRYRRGEHSCACPAPRRGAVSSASRCAPGRSPWSSGSASSRLHTGLGVGGPRPITSSRPGCTTGSRCCGRRDRGEGDPRAGRARRLGVPCGGRSPRTRSATSSGSSATSGDAPVPSIADLFYLSFYPATYIALLLLVRSRVSRFNRSVWLDGVSVALAVGAVGAAFLLEVALDHTEGEPSRGRDEPRLSARRRRPARARRRRVLARRPQRRARVARDRRGVPRHRASRTRVYLWMSAVGTYQEGTLLDILWPLMGILLAAAAWVRPGARGGSTLEGRPLVATPIVCTLMALAVFARRSLSRASTCSRSSLAAATIGIVLDPHLLTFRENSSIAASIQVLSVTDPLTHLWNRRKLLADLEDAHQERRRRSARARALRPQRLQALQRPLRPSGRRRAARAPRGEAHRRGGHRRDVLPPRRRRVLRSRPCCRKASSRRSSTRPRSRSARSGTASR